MVKRKLTYQELEKKLAEAEKLISSLRGSTADANAVERDIAEGERNLAEDERDIAEDERDLVEDKSDTTAEKRDETADIKRDAAEEKRDIAENKRDTAEDQRDFSEHKLYAAKEDRNTAFLGSQKLKEAYTESERNFRNSMDACPLGIRVITAEGRLFYANQAMLDITGCKTIEDLIAIPRDQLYTPVSYSTHLDRKEKRRRGESVPSEYEISIIRRDGEIRTLQVLRKEIIWGGERQYMAMYQDITERRKMEANISYLAGLIENVSDAIFSSNKEFQILSWNKAAENMYGWRVDEVLGKNVKDVIGQEPVNNRDEEFITSLRKNGALTGDIVHHRKNHESFHALATITIMKDEHGDEIGAVTVVKDISERIKAQEALREREEFLDRVIENTPSPLWVSDGAGTVIRMNQALRDLLHLTDAEVVGKYNVLKDVQVAEQGCLPLVKKVFEEGKTANFILKYKTGREIQIHPEREVKATLEIIISPVKDEHGKVVHAICQEKDISDRIGAEKALTESQERFYGAFHYSPSMNIIFTKETMRVVEINEAFSRLTDYTRDEMIGNTLEEMNFWSDPDQRTAVLTELDVKGKLINREVSLRIKNGNIRLYAMNLSVMASGNEHYLFASMIDITKRKQVEEALLASERRYRTSLDSMMEGCQIIDYNWRYVYVNDAFLKQTSQPRERFIGHTMMELNPQIENTKVFPFFRECMEQRIPRRMENELTLPNGAGKWYDLSIQPVPEGLFILSLDITERRTLEASLRYHAGLVESVSDAIISTSADYKIISWNKAAEEMYGWREDEVIGKRVMDVTVSELINETVPEIRDTLNKTSHWRGEAVHQRRNGEKIDVLISVSMLRDENGKEIGAVSVFKDITERNKAENAVHQSEERFRRIFQAGPLGITLATLNYEYTMVNVRCCEMFGYTEKEFLNLTFKDISFPEDVEINLPYLERLKKGELPYYITEKRYIKKNGKIFWGNLVVTILRDNEGKPQSFLSMVDDITSRKQDEERIANLNLALRAIRNINQLITREKNRDRLIQGVCDNLVTGRSFRSAWIILMDEARHPVSWASTDVLVGMEGVVENFRMGKFPSCVRKALAQKKVIITLDPAKRCPGCPLMPGDANLGSLTVRLETGGKLYGVLCGTMQSSALVDEDEVSLFSEVAADITFALRDIELSSSNEMLQQEQLRASKLESIGTLAGGIAHDFNNLLTGIMGNIGLAKTLLPDGSAILEVLDEAEKAAARSQHLTQQLLTFARGGKPIKKVVNITGTIKDSATFALRGSKTKLELSLPEDLWLVEADEGQISQVLHNLVLNADEAMPEGGTLSITIGNHRQKRGEKLPVAAGNYVRIDVRDTGIGIAPEHLQKMYEPYYTTKRQGSGLGLTTAYSIIKNHGGYLLAESVLNQGSVFHIYLPASKKTVKGEKIMAAKKSTQAGGKVLVMDDDEIIRKMLVSMLKLAGYEVEATADGAEAVENYRQAMTQNNPYSAVIMDLTVPGGMGGKEAVVKLLEIDPDASVIVSSGYATDPIMSEYKKYGFSAVIAKPYSIKQLQETLAGLNLIKKK
jgi:PAS domain S-box-containing protein